jgi:hypothetical protein
LLYRKTFNDEVEIKGTTEAAKVFRGLIEELKRAKII